jgi:hypothetical protein
MDIIHEIVDDTGDGDIINIQFIPFNKEKQEIKRSFKLGKFYLVRAIIHFAKSVKNPVP